MEITKAQLNKNRLGRLSLTPTRDTLCTMAFVLFFSQEAIRVVLATVLPFLESTGVTFLMILLMYLPLIILKIKEPGRISVSVLTFFGLLALVALFFGVSYLLHPEYEHWYFEGSYPVMRWIFRPNQFLYAFLFMVVMREPEKMLKALKISAYLLLVYYSYRLVKAMSLGYWIVTTTAAGPQHAIYDLSYGYDQLFVFAIFCACGFRERKLLYFVLASVSLVEILLGGSRGPLLYIAVMLIIMYLKYRKTISLKLRILMTAFIILLILFWSVMGVEGSLILLGTLLSRVLGSSSRTVQVLMSGAATALSGSGRDRLYGIALGMIRDGFWGYGAYGDRYVIGNYFWVGYSHNLYLELLIDFGWIVGGLFSLLVTARAVQMLFGCKDEAWFTVFIIVFTASLKLLTSGSFWFSEPFWAMLAVYYLYFHKGSFIRLRQKNRGRPAALAPRK